MLLLTSLALASGGASHDAILSRFDAHRAHVSDDTCLTGLVKDLRTEWGTFSVEERAELTAALAPWKSDLFEALPATGVPAPPDGDATDSCIGQQLGNRLTSQHFVVEWDTGVIDEDTAQDFLDALEDGWAVEVDELEWEAPEGAGRYLLPAYVVEGNYQSAYTTVEACGGRYLPYIVAYAGSFSQMSWANTMAVHEFNHAIQFNYGQAMEFWFWESTATWIESLVYPSVDWWSYYVTGYTQETEIAMAATSQQDQDVFYHMYGMAIWNFYLENYQGGPDTIRQIWLASRGEDGYYTFTQEDGLTELDLDFEAAYLDFIVRNTVMDYAEQRTFPEIRMDSVQELPAEDASRASTEPQGHGQHYFMIERGLGEGDLAFTLDAESELADWAVALVAVDDNEIVASEVVTLEAGDGTVTLPGYGEYDVVVVLSPLTDSTNDYGYTWTAGIVEPPVAELAEAEESGLGCGCATGGSAAPGALAAFGALALLRRRRR